MRLVWLTDIHLEFLSRESKKSFLENLAALSADAVLITGDIGTGRSVKQELEVVASALPDSQVFFVLGNHDYYGRSVVTVRASIAQGFNRPNLTYLSGTGAVDLGDVALVGHDGWADGRCGDWAGTQLRVSDFDLIREFRYLDRWARYRVMERLADEAAEHFLRVLPKAAEATRKVLVATHVPPFPEASFYENKPSTPEGLPFFANRSVGEALLEVAGRYTDCRFTVLCGHTHWAGSFQAAPNLLVRVAGAEYGKPTVEDILEWEPLARAEQGDARSQAEQ